jgi:SNF family Na+-dependent transporter
MQPVAIDGIKFYLTPEWHRLASAEVWSDASSQIFYSTGVCFGAVISLASYNTFNHNIYRDAIILAVGNSFTSLFSGFVVFSILGFMAHSQNTTVDQIVTQGPGLTFIAYPQAVTLLTVSPVWSTLFFIMLSLLALSSMFPMVENVITAVLDQFPVALAPFKFWVTIGVCLVSFLCGIILSSHGGMYVLQLFDTYAVGNALLFAGLMEVIVVAWRYGASRVIGNLQTMVGNRFGMFYFKYAWLTVTPTFLLFAIIFSLAQTKPVVYGNYEFPHWGTSIGWLLTATSLCPIPIYAVVKYIQHKRSREGMHMSFIQSIDFLTLPSEKMSSNYFKSPEMSPLKPVEL